MLKKLFAVCSAMLFLIVLLVSVSHHSMAAQARALTLDYNAMSAACYNEEQVRPFPTYAGYWTSTMASYWSTATTDNYYPAYEMADDSKWASGLDHTSIYIDNGDATTFWAHGGAHKVSGSSTYNRFQVRLSTDSGNPYPVECVLGDNYMLIGNDDAEFSHGFACHSTEWEIIWDNAPYDLMSGKIHHFGGFHGEARTSKWDVADDFAVDAFSGYESVSWAWLRNFYCTDCHDGWDICPVSLVRGEDSTDATNRKNYEDYNSGYDDPPETGGWTKYHFYCNCDPKPSTSQQLTCS